MTLYNPIFAPIVFCLVIGCSGEKLEKGFPVTSSIESKDENEPDGISKDSLAFKTRPSNVLLTGIPRYRLATIYKINYSDDSLIFIGSNDYHGNYSEMGNSEGNQWNYNLIPGIEAVYGYNLVNIAHHDTETHTQKNFFEKPVLIKTLYYPSFSKDTLNGQPVSRKFFMTSVYDDDTNKDGFINLKDLRRFYYFDIDAANRRPLVPVNYSVFKSEYDPANDFMYVFAQLDENVNGRIEELEPIHIFWIDLKNPLLTGRQY